MANILPFPAQVVTQCERRQAERHLAKLQETLDTVDPDTASMHDQMRRIGAEAFIDLARADLAKARRAEAAANAGIYPQATDLCHNGLVYHTDYGRA